jgi:hypothetical protein
MLMRSFRILKRSLTSGNFDAKLGKNACWFCSAVILVVGFIKITQLQLSEREFFFGLLLVLAVAVLGLILGILIPIAQQLTDKSQE